MEAFGLRRPFLPDDLSRCGALEGPQTWGVVAGDQDQREVPAPRAVCLAGVARRGRALDGPVPPFDVPRARRACTERQATIIASYSRVSTVESGSTGPIGRPAVLSRCPYFRTAAGPVAQRPARLLRLGHHHRKITQLIAARLRMRSHDARCDSLSATSWEAERPAAELLVQADRLVGGPDADLIVDDPALPKKGTSSVGMVRRYATVLGPNANCRTLVSLAPSADAQPLRLKEPT